ncbi:MAG: hypothetical protein WCJ35_28935, partial [Planctomycetota bacterium]
YSRHGCQLDRPRLDPQGMINPSGRAIRLGHQATPPIPGNSGSTTRVFPIACKASTSTRMSPGCTALSSTSASADRRREKSNQPGQKNRCEGAILEAVSGWC